MHDLCQILLVLLSYTSIGSSNAAKIQNKCLGCEDLIEEVFHAVTDETTFITKSSTDGRVQPLCICKPGEDIWVACIHMTPPGWPRSWLQIWCHQIGNTKWAIILRSLIIWQPFCIYLESGGEQRPINMTSPNVCSVHHPLKGKTSFSERTVGFLYCCRDVLCDQDFWTPT